MLRLYGNYLQKLETTRSRESGMTQFQTTRFACGKLCHIYSFETEMLLATFLITLAMSGATDNTWKFFGGFSTGSESVATISVKLASVSRSRAGPEKIG